MKIIEYAQIKFNLDSRNFSPGRYPRAIYPTDSSIYYIYFFLLEAYGRTYNQGILEHMNMIYTENYNYLYDTIGVKVDTQHDLIYLVEDSDNYDDKINTPELDQLAEEGDLVELCRRGIADHAVLTKENFLYLLLKWKKIVKKDSPYLLIYLNDKNWYDSEPFDSLQAMEEFIDQHIDKSIRYCDTAPQTKKSHDNHQQTYTNIIIYIVIIIMLLIKFLNLRL